jgi:hypothetical protein
LLTANTNTVASFTPPESTQLVNTIFNCTRHDDASRDCGQALMLPICISAQLNQHRQHLDTLSNSCDWHFCDLCWNSFELKSDVPVTGVNFDKPLQDAQDADFYRRWHGYEI